MSSTVTEPCFDKATLLVRVSCHFKYNIMKGYQMRKNCTEFDLKTKQKN